MTKQIELIGPHPGLDHPLGTWLFAEDILATDIKCHRKLRVMMLFNPYRVTLFI